MGGDVWVGWGVMVGVWGGGGGGGGEGGGVGEWWWGGGGCMEDGTSEGLR